LFIIGAYTKKLGDEQNSAVKYYCFDVNDLGVDLTTSVEENTEAVASSILVYPNPTSEAITIELSGVVHGLVYLYNTIGQMVASSNIDSDKVVISTSSLSAGIYYPVIEINGKLIQVSPISIVANRNK
jgi:hypothetical protein